MGGLPQRCCVVRLPLDGGGGFGKVHGSAGAGRFQHGVAAAWRGKHGDPGRFSVFLDSQPNADGTDCGLAGRS